MADIQDLTIVDASNTARFPENMAPSAVNDGARALEGIVARWHKDTNGSKASTGSANAYIFAADQTLSAYYDGLEICFDANFTNTGAATLNVDAVSVDPIVWPDQTALASGDIVSGSKITVIHDGTSWQIMSGGRSFLDEDDMASDSATAVSSQQAIKAYVSSQSGLILLASASPSAAASVDITSAITATYDTYLLVFSNLIPVTDDVGLWLRTSTDNGSAFDSGATEYSFGADGVIADGPTGSIISNGDDSNSEIVFTDNAATKGVGNASTEGISGKIWFYNPLNASVFTRVYFDAVWGSADSNYSAHVTGFGARKAAADVDAVQLLFESGNIASGEVRFYGVKSS